MTTWEKVEKGMQVMHDDAPHEVIALRRGGSSMRVVLLPLQAEGVVAKVALRVNLADKAQMPEGAETQAEDAVEEAVKSDLGGTVLATIDRKGRASCPAPDTTTIASHLKFMHGVELTGLPVANEDEMLKLHKELHAAPFHAPEHPHQHEVAGEVNEPTA